jgi:hypothetical protein
VILVESDKSLFNEKQKVLDEPILVQNVLIIISVSRRANHPSYPTFQFADNYLSPFSYFSYTLLSVIHSKFDA